MTPPSRISAAGSAAMARTSRSSASAGVSSSLTIAVSRRMRCRPAARAVPEGGRAIRAGWPGRAAGRCAGRCGRRCARCRQCRAGFSGLAGQSTVVFEQRLDGAVAGGGNVALAQRMVQRVAQQARAHAGDAVVEQREQRRRRLAAQGFGQFEVAPGGEVEAEVGAFEFDGQRRVNAAISRPVWPARSAAAPRRRRWPASGLRRRNRPATRLRTASQSRRRAESKSKCQSGWRVRAASRPKLGVQLSG